MVIREPYPKRLERLTWLSLTGSIHQNPLTIFQDWDLPSLTHLCVDAGSYCRDCDLSTILQCSGKKLKTLSLRGEFAMDDLPLAEYCPNLTCYEVDWTFSLVSVLWHPMVEDLIFHCDETLIGTPRTPRHRLTDQIAMIVTHRGAWEQLRRIVDTAWDGTEIPTRGLQVLRQSINNGVQGMMISRRYIFDSPPPNRPRRWWNMAHLEYFHEEGIECLGKNGIQLLGD
ncbi:hypothetical protein M422DRAFT_271601 [Sphaerobolus stellatus SS14]|uniref:Uncharacterized protein n=1 Tax=Sphaerobolus stellatus (strain SS14) TaxID=990650 RepID=A0A0C9UP40_SPHS4|nr:hypothetical protein M422DRAFT_271601 [Sphaerobolus stellatus SS14]